MVTRTRTAAELIAKEPTLDRLRLAAADCKAFDLWTRATQTVFGTGDEKAGVMLIGEQTGDAEDVERKPFDGPTGKFWIASFAKRKRQRSFRTCGKVVTLLTAKNPRAVAAR